MDWWRILWRRSSWECWVTFLLAICSSFLSIEDLFLSSDCILLSIYFKYRSKGWVLWMDSLQKACSRIWLLLTRYRHIYHKVFQLIFQEPWNLVFRSEILQFNSILWQIQNHLFCKYRHVVLEFSWEVCFSTSDLYEWCFPDELT